MIPADRATGPLGLLDRELTDRMGHSSTRAAMIYQYATRDRDKAIAKALGELASKAHASACPSVTVNPPVHCSIGH